MVKINYFEDSDCYKDEQTELNVNDSYVQFQLANQSEYRKNEALYATVNANGVHYRILLNDNNTITKYGFPFVNNVKAIIIGENDLQFKCIVNGVEQIIDKSQFK
jgi:uncharacterized membrane protein YgaE (UPF0421/DUF939 family)